MRFDKQPSIAGSCVAVRPLRSSDYDALFTVASDPLIWEQHPVPRHQEAVFRDFFDESLKSEGCLVVTDLETGGVIGSSRFHGYSQAGSEIEIGWSFLARSHWGGTYNGDLKSIMLHRAFRFVESVVFLIDATNLRSQRATAKIGAVVEPDQDRNGRLIFRLNRSDLSSIARPQNDDS